VKEFNHYNDHLDSPQNVVKTNYEDVKLYNRPDLDTRFSFNNDDKSNKQNINLRSHTDSSNNSLTSANTK